MPRRRDRHRPDRICLDAERWAVELASFAVAAVASLTFAACTPAEQKPAEAPKGCATCDVRFVLEDKLDLVTLEYATIVLDNRVVFRSQRWAHDADVGPLHVMPGAHVARVLLVYRKDENAYDVRSEHEFEATEGLVLGIKPKQGGPDLAPTSERIGIAWEELKP